jgi:hypothetical protein
MGDNGDVPSVCRAAGEHSGKPILEQNANFNIRRDISEIMDEGSDRCGCVRRRGVDPAL